MKLTTGGVKSRSEKTSCDQPEKFQFVVLSWSAVSQATFSFAPLNPTIFHAEFFELWLLTHQVQATA
jgi:hypothetical protein